MLDIGGGSTEFIVGRGHDVGFHVSTQIGVVRLSERHLHDDPPAPGQLAALAADARAGFADAIPADVRGGVDAMIAVAGTATSMAAIDQALEPYDPRARRRLRHHARRVRGDRRAPGRGPRGRAPARRPGCTPTARRRSSRAASSSPRR